MTTNRKAQAQLTREAILDVAEGVFFEMGLSSTTLEEIARRANVSRGAIYWHFTNKVEVFEAVFERTISFYEQLLEAVTSKASSLQEFSDAMVDLLRDIALTPEKQRALSIIMLRHEHLEPHVVSIGAACNERVIALLADFFQRMAVSKDFPEGTSLGYAPRLLAEAVSCHLNGLITKYLMYPKSIHLEQDAAFFVRIIFSAIMMPALSNKKGNTHGHQ
jgi:AcrR family transcriptional regulator